MNNNNSSFNLKLYEKIKNYGSKIARIDPHSGKSQTYEDIHKRSLRIAIEMNRFGLKKGDNIILCAKDSFFMEIPFLSALYLGVVPTPLYYSTEYDELKHMIQLIDPKLIFFDKNCEKKIENILKDLSNINCKLILFESDEFAQMLKPKNKEENFQVTHIDDPENDLAFIVSTSGTTGKPKGVPIRYYAANCRFNNFNETADMTVMYYSVFSWLSGIILFLIWSFYGSKRIIADWWETKDEDYLKFIEKFKVNWILLNQVVLSRAIRSQNFKKYDLSSLKVIVYSGHTSTTSKMKELSKAFGDKVEMVNSYSTTETFLECTKSNTSKPLKDENTVVVTCGIIKDDVQYKLLNFITEKPITESNTVGELYLKMPSLMKGYYKDEIRTKEAFDSDGFFKTRDLAYIDENKYLYIIGRKDDMIFYDDNLVIPYEIEDILFSHEAIDLVTVTGKLDKTHGQLPIAFVKLKPNSNVKLEEINQYFEGKINSDAEKLRGGIIIVNDLPLTSSGKVKRKLLLERHEQNN